MATYHPWYALAFGMASLVLGIFCTKLALSARPERIPLTAPASAPVQPRQLAYVLIGAMLAAATAAAIGFTHTPSIVSVAIATSSPVGIALGIVDLRARRLPYAMTFALYVCCAVAFTADSIVERDATALIRAALGSVAALIVFLSLALVFPGQLGLGDVLLFGWVIFSLAWFGWHSVAVGALVGLTGQALIGLAVRARRGGGATIPMGPALLVGWLVGVLMVK